MYQRVSGKKNKGVPLLENLRYFYYCIGLILQTLGNFMVLKDEEN